MTGPIIRPGSTAVNVVTGASQQDFIGIGESDGLITDLTASFAPVAARATPLRGVNFSGLEFADGLPTAVPGTLPTNPIGSLAAYAEIQAGTANMSRLLETDFQYFAAQGLGLIRLPFNWERLQPLLKQPLDATFLGYIQEAVGWARTYGCKVILDLHNFGGRYVYPVTAGVGGVFTRVSQDETAALPISAVADVWYRLAQVFGGDPAVQGYDLMNEPQLMPIRLGYGSPQEQNTLNRMHQACINAIRKIDNTSWIWLETENVAIAGQWNSYIGNKVFSCAAGTSGQGAVTPTATETSPWWNDPAGRTGVSVHLYQDTSQGASYQMLWTQACRDRLLSQIGPPADWCKRYGVPLLIGECGVPGSPRAGSDANSVTQWQADFGTLMGICDTYPNIYVTGWNAGPVPSATPFEPRDGSSVIDYTATNANTEILKAHTGSKVAPLTAGGTGADGDLGGGKGRARNKSIIIGRYEDSGIDLTRGGEIEADPDFGFDLYIKAGRWTEFRDRVGNVFGRFNTASSNNTSWLSHLRIGSVTGPMFQADTASRVSARDGGNLSSPADLLARGFIRTVVTPSSASGVLTLNAALGTVFVVTLTENISSWSITNPPADGGQLTVCFVQPSSGGPFTVGGASSVTFAAGYAPTMSTTASAHDTFTFDRAGSAWKERSRSRPQSHAPAGWLAGQTPVDGLIMANSGTFTHSTYTSGITTRVPKKASVACTDLRVVITNMHLSAGGNNAPANTVTYKCAIEVSGAYYPLTFNGQRSIVCDGWAAMVSDPLGIDLAAGDTFYVRSNVKTPSGTGAAPYGLSHGGIISQSFSAGGYALDADLVDGTGTTSLTTSNPAFGFGGAIGVVATPLQGKTPVVLGVGDSITSGSGDNGATYQGGGYFARGLNNTFPGIITAAPSISAQTWASMVSERTSTILWGMATDAVCLLGTNDFAAARTAAQVEADIMTISARLRKRSAMRTVRWGTVPPKTTTTDSYATTANQTIASGNAERVLYNNWLRGGAPVNATTLAPVAVGTSGALLAGSGGHPISGYVETADAVESARDSGKWAVNGTANYATADGTHPGGNAGGAAAMAVPLATYVATLTM